MNDEIFDNIKKKKCQGLSIGKVEKLWKRRNYM